VIELEAVFGSVSTKGRRLTGVFLAGILLIQLSALSAKGQSSTDDLGNPLTGSGGLTQSGTSPYDNQDYNTSNQLGSQNTYSQGQAGQNSLSRGSDLQSNQTVDSSSRTSTNRDEFTQQLLRNLPPDQPTEFQKMVASSTGRLLPIYGAQLFRNPPSTFAPLDRVPVTPDYVVGPGDELLIQIWGQVTLNSRFTVDRSGSVYIPQVGSVRVAGLAFGQLQEFLKAQVGRVFRNFDLNVNMGQLRSIQVFVVGNARRPGSYTVSSLSTLVNALFVTGGPSPQGSLRHIQLKRAGKVVVDFDLYDLLHRGDKSQDAQLLPGDVIYIPPVGAQVAVVGSVNTPAIYELKSAATTTVDEVLDLASGPTNVASNRTVHLERVDAHRNRSVFNLSLDAQGRATILMDGDILELVSIVNQFSNGVTLRGNVANPGHYGWRQGMKVGDLFPDREALITRDYWLKRGQLGQPVLSYVPVCPPPPRPVYPNTYTTNSTNGNLQQGTQIPMNGANGMNGTNNNVVNSNDRAMEDDRARAEDNSNGCITLPASLRNNSDIASQDVNQPVVTAQGRSPQDQPTANQDPMQRASSAAGGLSAATAMLAPQGQFPARNDVKLSAPDIDWSYAVIERQNKETLTTSLLPFNLGRLVLGKDESQNLDLKPGDVITIFSKADIHVPQAQQTRFVRLEGEFISSGVYSVLPGETLQDVVKRAGGFTRDAYLYGSEFTRESTRRVQQQRLNEYVDQIALQASTNSVNSAGRAISALDSAAASASASQTQGVLNSLRQMRSTGRIVLQIQPESNTVSQLPAIPLEDGDRFMVPHVPNTVNVTGAVYNPNSFLFDRERRLKDYLQLAGGSNRDADQKSTYVIRADGAVVSRRQMSKWRKDRFDNLRIYPGDTVVIPLNLSKGATIRNVVDIAQIVGQFGIALAAGNTIF
jgi:protein involved in polysaccharide export with SLBB domain